MAYKLAFQGTGRAYHPPARAEEISAHHHSTVTSTRATIMPGVVTGLAWTSVGGEILFIETSLSQGKQAGTDPYRKSRRRDEGFGSHRPGIHQGAISTCWA